MEIVSTAALEAAQRQLILAAAPEARVRDRTCRKVEEISELVADGCDVLLTFRLPDDLAARAPDLKWVQLLSAGAEHALRTPLRNSDVVITTASGIHATPIAEYVLTSMLAWAHRFHVMGRMQLRREWMRQGGFVRQVDELRGKTVAVIGYGSIGRETARLAKSFGMRVLALKRNPDQRRDPGWSPAGVGDPEGTIPERFFGPEECGEILKLADYIVVTLPGTRATHHMIGARELESVKAGAYLVNIGRGEVIDEPAMIEALRSKRLGGAGLDVFEQEPLDSASPLWEMEEVILTPHMSGAVRNYMDKACDLFSENLRLFVSNRPLLNVVDRELGY